MSDDDEKKETPEAVDLSAEDAADSDIVQRILSRPVSENDFYYMLSRYPYLQICDINFRPPKEPLKKLPEPKIIKSRCGWDIQDFGSFMRAGAGIHNMGIREDDEGGGDGTLVWKYVITAEDLVKIAQDKGWAAARVVSGYYLMQRAFWVAAELENYVTEGFDATDEDKVVLYWIRSFGAAQRPQRAKPTLG